jgi:hypothetical protein
MCPSGTKLYIVYYEVFFAYPLLICRSADFEIRAGKAYVVKITPTYHHSTYNFQTIPMVKRKCRLNSEREEESIFSYYTQKTCIYECTLKKIVPTIVSILILCPIPV